MRKLLFFVEGFTDIRYVVGLSEIADLTLCVPAGAYAASGLRERIAASGARVQVHEIVGGRAAYQWRSFAWLWRHAREFDVILSQELLRGSLNATIVGALRGVPVITTIMLAPVEYFRCRRRRGQIGALPAVGGEAVIRMLMTINGRLSTRCVALGEYLNGVASRYCARTVAGGYYGVDTTFFTPVSGEERAVLRRRLELPDEAFIIFLASRISHEKDPETVLRATAMARARGLDAVLLNLSGGYKEFLELARTLNLPDPDRWVIGRPAAHPMLDLNDYFRSADVVAQASLAEGLGLSPLEALASGVPVVASRVGGMAVTLPGYARLVEPQDAEAMAQAFLWISEHPEEARAEALRGRQMVESDWSRTKAFGDMAEVIRDVTRDPAARGSRLSKAIG
jgi:glycosyltransferase involved in cell wall biosynthesis